MRRLAIILVCLLLLTLAPNVTSEHPRGSRSASHTWDGGGADNNASTKENWAGDTAPEDGDAIILTGSKDCYFDAAHSFASITVTAYTGTVRQNATVTVTGSLAQYAGTWNTTGNALDIDGNLTVNGTMVIWSASLDAGGIYVNGTGKLNLSTTTNITNGNLHNTGILNGGGTIALTYGQLVDVPLNNLSCKSDLDCSNNSIIFDGTDDYIDYGDNFDMGLSDRTVEFWFNTTDTDGNFVSKSAYAAVTNRWYVLLESNVFKVGIHVGATSTTVAVANAWSDGRWHHCVAIWDRDAAMSLYIDGIARGTANIATAGTNMDSAYSCLVGRYNNETGTGPHATALKLNGYMSKIHIYNQALTAAQVWAAYCGRYPAFAGRYDFVEGSGTTATDTSGNAINGAMLGVSWSNQSFSANNLTVEQTFISPYSVRINQLFLVGNYTANGALKANLTGTGILYINTTASITLDGINATAYGAIFSTNSPATLNLSRFGDAKYVNVSSASASINMTFAGVPAGTIVHLADANGTAQNVTATASGAYFSVYIEGNHNLELRFPPTANAGANKALVIGESVTLDGSGSDPEGQALNYTWDMDDGTTLYGASVTHTYAAYGTYTATLTVTDADGLNSTDTATVRVKIAPVAEAGADRIIQQYETITLDGTLSTDADGTISSYEWTIESTTQAGAIIACAFNSVGTFLVTLNVTDGDGLSDEDTLTVIVLPSPYSHALAPTANAGPDCVVNVSELVHFSANLSTDEDGTIDKYLWNIAGLTLIDGMLADYRFALPGTYIITLTVIDNDGISATDTATVIVRAPFVPIPHTNATNATTTNATATQKNNNALIYASIAGTIALVVLAIISRRR